MIFLAIMKNIFSVFHIHSTLLNPSVTQKHSPHLSVLPFCFTADLSRLLTKVKNWYQRGFFMQQLLTFLLLKSPFIPTFYFWLLSSFLIMTPTFSHDYFVFFMVFMSHIIKALLKGQIHNNFLCRCTPRKDIFFIMLAMLVFSPLCNLCLGIKVIF